MVHPIDPDSIRAVANELRGLHVDPSAAHAEEQRPESEPSGPASEVLLGLSRLIEQLGQRLGVDLSGRDPGEIIGRLQLLARLLGKASPTELLSDLDSPATRDRIATFLRPLPRGPTVTLPIDPGRIGGIWQRLVSRDGPGLRAWLSRELPAETGARLERELTNVALDLGLAGPGEPLVATTWAGNPTARAAGLAVLLRLVPRDVLLRLVEDELARGSLDSSVRPDQLTPYLARLGSTIRADLMGSARAPLVERLHLLVTFLRAGTLVDLIGMVRDEPEIRELVRALLTDPDAIAGGNSVTTTPARPADQALAAAGVGVSSAPQPVASPGALARQLGGLLNLPPSALARLDERGLTRTLAGLASLRGFGGPEQLLAAATAQPDLRQTLGELVRAVSGGAPDARPDPRGAAPALRGTTAALLGITLDLHDPVLLERTLAALAGQRGFAGAGHLLVAAQESPALREALRELFGGGPQRLFEEPDQFQQLMAVRARGWAGGSAPPVRIWNPACGRGLDACTLAIAAGESNPPLVVRILATDEPGAPLEAARRAVYPWSVAAPLGPERGRRWFRHYGQSLELAPDARAMIDVQSHHLLDPAPGTDFGAVVCRRRLPGLTGEAVAAAFERFADALLGGGWLLVDEGLELPTAVADRFRQLAPGRFERT